MAREKTASETQDNRTEELQAQIAQLKEDIAAIAATLSDIGADKISEARHTASDKYQDLYDQGEDAVNTLKNHAQSVEQQITEYVQVRPITSLALAVAFGYLFSALTRR
jgi:ElaB/YqjD/DUF883 family membrane-anchored ribosome-binding protein